MKCNTVNWTKMTLDSAKLLLKDQVKESGVELAYPSAGCGDLHGFLTSTKHHLAVKIKFTSATEKLNVTFENDRNLIFFVTKSLVSPL